MGILPPRPPEAPPALPVPDHVVSEPPPAPQVIDVRPEAPRAPLVVVSQPLGSSVSLHVPTGLR